MKGKPFLVAVAAFVIVLFGGVAIAGVGSIGSDTGDDALETSHAAEPDVVIEAPEWTSTTEAETPKETTTTAPAEKTSEEPGEDKEEKVSHESEEDDKDSKEDGDAEESDHEESDEAKEHPTADVDLFSLDYPENGIHVTKKVLAFGGTADEGVVVHRGKYEAVSKEGAWVMELVLSPGRNAVTFKATNGEGGIEAEVVTVFYDAPESEEGEEKKEEPKSTFTAHQKYGSCGEEVPYDVFWGTAKPGAKITASSEYGGKSVEANDDGHWEMKVLFPESAPGKTFNVKIKASTGHGQTFTFTNTQSGEDH